MLEVLWVIIPIIAIVMFLLYWFCLRSTNDNSQMWDCVEGGCEKVLDGKYKSYEQCKNKCTNEEGYCDSKENTEDVDNRNKKKVKRVTFAGDDSITIINRI